MARFEVKWRGPWDGKARPERILVLEAKDKAQASKLHEALFPAASRKITLARRKAVRA